METFDDLGHTLKSLPIETINEEELFYSISQLQLTKEEYFIAKGEIEEEAL